ncbi:MAG: pyrroline-5-carboxylate reductase [Patescibacteria group bacterium]
MNIGIIGAGNMGGALYKNLRLAGDVVVVADRNEQTQKRLNLPPECYFESASKMLDKKAFDVLMLCIKPQSLDAFASECFIAEKQPKALLISILAGTSLRELSAKTGMKRIIRAMPNLAVTVGAGVIGWVASDLVNKYDRDFCENTFSKMGLSLELKTEEQINQITSLSGSGPAYFFYLTEVLQQQAETYGFPREQAQAIAVQTAVGAAHVMQGNGQGTPGSPKEWRQAVTSKKGTTEAALQYLQAHAFEDIFKEAVLRAKERAEELSG